MEKPVISIIGLGLMGGSLAFAANGFLDADIIGFDCDKHSCELALSSGAVKKIAKNAEDAVSEADLTIFCTPPMHIMESFEKLACFFKKDSIVTEICGVKHKISESAARFLPESVNYVGIHPMAGKEVWGFENADAAIFKDCGFIITTIEATKNESVELMKSFAKHIGALRITVATPEKHDRIIAFSSDLMHVSSAALCLEIPKDFERAYTAGAFRDCTRVAYLCPELWCELLSENSEMVINAIENQIKNLESYRAVLKDKNREELLRLLKTSSDNKLKILNS